MDTKEFCELVRVTSRDRFVVSFPHLFLVTAEVTTGAIEFDTVITGGSGATGDEAVMGAAGLRVLALVKAKGNPYPDRVSIGRARNCDVVIRDLSISKLHAHLRDEGGGRRSIVDLGSQNGTRRNRVRLSPNEPEYVVVGDHIAFG